MNAATVLLFAVIILTAVSLLFIFALERFERRKYGRPVAPPRDELERFLGLEVIVNTRRPDDQAVKGTLLDVGAAWLELRNPTWLPTSAGAGEEAPMGGTALIGRDHVAYVQALSGAPVAVLVR